MVLDNEGKCQAENFAGLNSSSYEGDIAAIKVAIKKTYARALCRHIYEHIPLVLNHFAHRTHAVVWIELVDMLDEATVAW